MNVWFELTALGLLAIGGLLLLRSMRDVETRAAGLERELAELREQESVSAQETRRAHVRLDNHLRELKAMRDQLGWADEHARTKMLTGTVPKDVLPPKVSP